MKVITVPLREFALPVPRVGSIEANSGFGRSAAEGQEIHQRVQKQRVKLDPSYQAEVPISGSFDREGFRFHVQGRMDGIFRNGTPTIEEIKGTFNVRELARRLSDAPFGHPYCLQLLTYGYLYWREHSVIPTLTFHLVSSRSGESIDLPLVLDVQAYEEWLQLRLAELAVEATLAEKRAARRRKIGADFKFPFSTPRPKQLDLLRTIEEGMLVGQPILLQAPTGLGKTVGVLYPVLKEALGRGQKVIYLTPKNSLHSVAEDAVARFQETGAKVKSLSITAKGKICFKNEPLCDPDYCEYARDYYKKFFESGIREVLAKKRKLKARMFREVAEAHQLCPFELQLDCIEEADVVICDYNYVFAPRSALRRVGGIEVDQTGKPNLVIDEAHNLPPRAMDYYSPALSTAVLEGLRPKIAELQPRFRREADDLLDRCVAIVSSCAGGKGGKGGKGVRIDPPVALFLEQDAALRAFLSRYLDSDLEIEHGDPVMALSFYWSGFTETLEYFSDGDRTEFFATCHPHPTGATVKITCCDASAMLKECYAEYQQVVGFSATLKPFEYYAKLSGLIVGKTTTAEFGSPFPKELRKLLIIPQISTKYADRERNYPKVAEAVRRMAELRRGNYFVFFPSFEFLERVAALFRPPDGFTLLFQERSMNAARVEAVVDHLRAQTVPTIVFAVQGGSFSEGMDYAGESVIGAFVVGPPLPSYDLEREEMKEYYQREYGAGFDYAYIYPAMAKAVQAAGRVIRSETERGLIVLMDNRFTQTSFTRCMPADWFDTDVAEIVSGRILQDVGEFWER
ncbi:ATP-dependent DNA helicase [Geomonas sp. RF6]|uniref:ATP-dependent DNA helicase n=1 Tax=Geomonas sp. RF6 TaxID=2897342 RepID=UPI001E477F81|nr:ATP-dependent DNA helicase [Geomonas sp. RF6]UFS69581.1 ATP-dependent DNA helicase [Geomonas sp. RF6]